MSLLSSLQQIVGEGNASIDPAELAANSTDASGKFGEAVAIAYPTDEDQVRKIILFANSRDYNLVPRGAGTGLAGAAVPEGSIIVDFSKMARIKQINVKERYVVTDPGVVLDDLNEALAEHKLFFPVIPSSHEVCTIGGMAAANAAGLRALKYGKMSDWIAGMRTIDGTGKSFTFNGANDFVGSEGILGFITELKLKVTKEVKVSKHEKLTFSTTGELVRKIDEILPNEKILSMEYLDPISSEMKGLDNTYHLFIEYEEAPKEGDSESVMEEREGVSVVLGSAGYTIMEDPLIPRERMAEFLDWLKKNRIPNFGHIGYGIVHPRFKPEHDDLVRQMFEKVVELGGKASGEHGYGITKREFLDDARKSELKALKKKYDPQSIINRGKVI
jgi:FAD/FMN-containing dehydrogenase